MRLFIKCEEANHTCDKSQYKEATLWEKVKLNLHLIICAACRKYSARNAKLSKIIKESKTQSLSKNQKDLLKEQLRQKMSE